MLLFKVKQFSEGKQKSNQTLNGIFCFLLLFYFSLATQLLEL